MDTSLFTKTLSHIPNLFQTMAPSTDSDFVDHKPSFTDTINFNENSDPAVNVAILSDNHPIHLLDIAREHYSRQKPPFVIGNRPENHARNVVVPTTSGQRPAVPTRLQVVARPWDAKNMFWTLDLNNIRYIVKAHNG